MELEKEYNQWIKTPHTLFFGEELDWDILILLKWHNVDITDKNFITKIKSNIKLTNISKNFKDNDNSPEENKKLQDFFGDKLYIIYLNNSYADGLVLNQKDNKYYYIEEDRSITEFNLNNIYSKSIRMGIGKEDYFNCIDQNSDK